MAEQRQANANRRGMLDGFAFPPGNAAASVRAIGFRTLLNLRCDPAEAATAAALQEVLGAALPQQPNRWSGDESRVLIWLGPDEWLILAADGEADTLTAQIQTATAGHGTVSLVDLSHGYTGMELSGARAREVLSRGCPLDLHRRAFGSGACAQSVLAGTSVLLRTVDDARCIELWVRNSFARYTAAWLVDAMAEFLEPGPPT